MHSNKNSGTKNPLIPSHQDAKPFTNSKETPKNSWVNLIKLGCAEQVRAHSNSNTGGNISHIKPSANLANWNGQPETLRKELALESSKHNKQKSFVEMVIAGRGNADRER